MTLTELITLIDGRFNSANDAFFSEQFKLDCIWQACQVLARQARIMEQRYSTTTVAGTREYSFPTQLISIDRITYDGEKLEPISMSEDDILTMRDEDSTTQGTPRYYYTFNEIVFLRPIPDDAKTLRIWSIIKPQRLTTVTATIEISEQYHTCLADFVLHRMALKERDFQAAREYQVLWAQHVADAEIWERAKYDNDILPVVLDLDAVQSFPRW